MEQGKILEPWSMGKFRAPAPAPAPAPGKTRLRSAPGPCLAPLALSTSNICTKTFNIITYLTHLYLMCGYRFRSLSKGENSFLEHKFG